MSKIYHQELREICNIQLWLAENYTTLSTSSDEMTRRAQKYVEQRGKWKIV